MNLTTQIKKSLKQRYSDKTRWAYFNECPVGSGWRGTNFMDAFVIAIWPSDQNRRIAFEIKISRQDFLNEFRKPNKRRPALFFSNEFYFVSPKDLLNPEEIPSDSGLIEYFEDGKLVTKIKAPFRESIRPNWNFVGALLRNQIKQLKENEQIP